MVGCGRRGAIVWKVMQKYAHTILHSPQQCERILRSHILTDTLLLPHCSWPSQECEVVSLCGFVFPDKWWYWAYFLCLIGRYIFPKKTSIRSFTHFKIGYYWIVKNLYIFWAQVIRYVICRSFLPLSGLPFHVRWWHPWSPEVLILNTDKVFLFIFSHVCFWYHIWETIASPKVAKIHLMFT